MQITASRVVAFLTPVFAAGSAALTPWLVKYTGLHIGPSEVTTLSVTGATAAAAAALKWLHGSSLWERDQAAFERYANPVEHAVETADPNIDSQIDAAAKSAEAKLVAVIEPAAPVEAMPPAPPAAVNPPPAA